ncbi:MAG: TspO/MBR family protein [Pseudomonadota bacterium]
MSAGQRGWLVYVIALVLAFGTASLGGAVTDLGDWYQNLEQPPWKPPDFAFGPVWTTIFALLAVAGALAWQRATTARQRRRIALAFAANGLLNVGWSFLFFYVKRPDWSVLEVGFLWLSIVIMIIVSRASSRLAGWLLVPYLVWVSFAAVLNYAVVERNAPF